MNNRLSLIVRKEYDRQPNFWNNLAPCTVVLLEMMLSITVACTLRSLKDYFFFQSFFNGIFLFLATWEEDTIDL